MGGCRCTYKNCTVRSDGKTHLFHFPVFDKVRCHQWLINAGRYDFLHLRVSQLKNRCICQHHFEDNNFMNDCKDKLKLVAVPTLDGPYCDMTKVPKSEMPLNNDLCPIAHEDIENDEYIRDRKANYHLRYSDFLTNGDADPMLYLDQKLWDGEENEIKRGLKHVSPKIINIFNTNSKININDPLNDLIDVKPCWDTLAPEKPPQVQTVPNTSMNPTDVVKITVPTRQLPKKRTNRIRIISEKKITEPRNKIPIPESLKVVSPSMVLSVNNRKKNTGLTDTTSQPSPILNVNNDKSGEINNVKSEGFYVPVVLDSSSRNLASNVKVEQPQVISFDTRNLNNEVNKKLSHVELQTNHENENIVKELASYDPSQFEIKINVEESVPPTPVKETRSLLLKKTKLSAERVAAINEKRKFNMKLRDIIDEGLNRPDEKEAVKMKAEDQKKIQVTETVASSFSKEPSLPHQNDYIAMYLESRMKKMENLLLNKIDQNAIKIIELKNSLKLEKKDPPVSVVSTTKKKESKSSIEAHKKYIYNEISKFLTPGTSSLVYEELFISKFKPNELNADTAQSSAKRKRRR